MNRTDWLTDELIEAAFGRRADRVAPDGLGDGILSQTADMRQRRAWAVRLTSGWSMAPARPAWVAIAVLAALVGLAIALALVGQRPTTPFRTGLLAYISDGDIYLAQSDGSGAEVAIHQDGVAFSTVAWAPGGRLLALDGSSGAVLFDPVTGMATYIGGSDPVWSPDGRQLAVLEPSTASAAARGAVIRIVNVSTATTSITYPIPAIGGLAWSPNGRWIAANGGSGERSNALVRIDVATGEVIQLDGPSGLLDAPREAAWSPDSAQISYVRWDVEGGSACMCATDVFIANADGSKAVRLNAVPGQADQPSWSPDGQWVAFRQARHDVSSSMSTVSGIAITRRDGTGERSIAADAIEAFAWSPEGDRLRLAHDNGQGQPATIWETSLTGVNHPLSVSIDGGYLFESTGNRAAWQAVASTAAAPQLPSIAQATPGATPEIVTPVAAGPADPSSAWPMLALNNGCEPSLVSTRDGATTTFGSLCDPVFGDISGSWSPTGAVFAGIRGGQLAILGRDGHARYAVDALVGLTSWSWSPDGTWLRIAGSQTSIVHADGSGLRELPGTPTWAPDGRVIAVATTDGTLLIGAGDGTGLRAIGSFPAPATWSADGSRFAFIRNGNLWSAASDGTDVREITTFPLGGVTTAAMSPDDRWIAVEVGHGLWIMRPDGSERRWLNLGISTSLGDPVWSPDATKLAIEADTDTASGQGSRVLLVNADGSPTIQIDSATAPSWSPDGHFLVVTSAEPPPTVDSPPGHLELMNGNGSGRHQLPTAGDGSPPVWVQ